MYAWDYMVHVYYDIWTNTHSYTEYFQTFQGKTSIKPEVYLKPAIKLLFILWNKCINKVKNREVCFNVNIFLASLYLIIFQKKYNFDEWMI